MCLFSIWCLRSMDLFLPLFIFYILSVVAVVYVLLFGESDFHRNGIVGKLNQFLNYGLWARIRSIGPKVVGNAIWSRVSACSTYIFHRKNPLMQIFYLILVVGGSSLCMWSGFEHIPGLYLSNIHKITFPAWLMFVVGFFIFTSYSDPGRITPEKWHEYSSIFPVDNLIYGPGFCKTCKHQKIARSKHCSLCGFCSMRHDHHCPWVNNCVGLLNLRYFLLFLLFTGMIINYVTYLTFFIIKGIIDGHGLWFYQDEQGAVFETPYIYILQYLVYYISPIVGLFAFTVFIGLVVYGFLGYHLWLIWSGTTTNETFKWSDYHRNVADLKKQGVLSPTSVDEDETPVVRGKKAQNIYNRGFKQNFYEVFFPTDPRIKHSINGHGISSKNQSHSMVHDKNHESKKKK